LIFRVPIFFEAEVFRDILKQRSGHSTIVSQLRVLTDWFLSFAAQDLNIRSGLTATGPT